MKLATESGTFHETRRALNLPDGASLARSSASARIEISTCDPSVTQAGSVCLQQTYYECKAITLRFWVSLASQSSIRQPQPSPSRMTVLRDM